jgi:AcrR family transcriptional regulator
MTARLTRPERARQTRQRIVDTAQQLFGERGYEATSLQLIADEIGVTKAAVYYYFKTKTDILQAMAQPGLELTLDIFEQAEQLTDPGARLEALGRGYVDTLIARRPTLTLLIADPMMRSRMHTEVPPDAFERRAIRLLYGPRATPRQRACFYAALGVSEILPRFADLTDDELRPVLADIVLTLLRHAG